LKIKLEIELDRKLTRFLAKSSYKNLSLKRDFLVAKRAKSLTTIQQLNNFQEALGQAYSFVTFKSKRFQDS
jgi:hypothetical protein